MNAVGQQSAKSHAERRSIIALQVHKEGTQVVWSCEFAAAVTVVAPLQRAYSVWAKRQQHLAAYKLFEKKLAVSLQHQRCVHSTKQHCHASDWCASQPA
eukprot:4951-Heterococcus_DN1.PRE.2